MEARIDRLESHRDEPMLPAIWRERLQRLFAVAGPAPEALDELRVLADHMPAIAEATERLAARLRDLGALGVDPGTIHFDASHGRQTMEYYDGFTFSFTAPGRADWPPVSSGGRRQSDSTMSPTTMRIAEAATARQIIWRAIRQRPIMWSPRETWRMSPCYLTGIWG